MIGFELTPEQEMIRKLARDFVEGHVKPNVVKWEEDGSIPDEVVQEAGKLGLLGAPIPVEYGGAGLDALSYAVVTEEMGRGCSSLRTTFSVNTSLFGRTVLEFGSEEQKAKWLPPICTGDKRGAWALTESHSGSDAAGMRCTATPSGDGHVLNGRKMWISDGDRADFVAVFARVGPKGHFDPQHKRDNLACFVVEKGTPGFSTGTIMAKNKLGLRASHTAELVLDNCHVPKANLLGRVGDGWMQANSILQSGRLSVAAGAVGIAQAALEASIEYVNTREAFGREIGRFQLVQEHVANMAKDVQAGRLLVWHAAWLKDQGKDNALAVSLAKLFTAEMVMRVTESAVQLHGGNGYSGEYPVERYFRDAKICGIYEGTNEIQKIIIANKVLGTE